MHHVRAADDTVATQHQTVVTPHSQGEEEGTCVPLPPFLQPLQQTAEGQAGPKHRAASSLAHHLDGGGFVLVGQAFLPYGGWAGRPVDQHTLYEWLPAATGEGEGREDLLVRPFLLVFIQFFFLVSFFLHHLLHFFLISSLLTSSRVLISHLFPLSSHSSSYPFRSPSFLSLLFSLLSSPLLALSSFAPLPSLPLLLLFFLISFLLSSCLLLLVPRLPTLMFSQ